MTQTQPNQPNYRPDTARISRGGWGRIPWGSISNPNPMPAPMPGTTPTPTNMPNISQLPNNRGFSFTPNQPLPSQLQNQRFNTPFGRIRTNETGVRYILPQQFRNSTMVNGMMGMLNQSNPMIDRLRQILGRNNTTPSPTPTPAPTPAETYTPTSQFTDLI